MGNIQEELSLKLTFKYEKSEIIFVKFLPDILICQISSDFDSLIVIASTEWY